MTAADPRDGLRAKCPRCGDNDPLATQVSVDSCRGFKYAVMTCRCGHGEVAAYYDDDRSLQDLSDKFYRIAHARPEAVDDRVRHELCDCPNGRAEHADWCAAIAKVSGQ